MSILGLCVQEEQACRATVDYIYNLPVFSILGVLLTVSTHPKTPETC